MARIDGVQFSTLHSKLSTGFTLVEILVVLGIITLVVALGVPVFNALSGARSTEAGRNIASAAIGQARTIAVNEGKYAGVLFYVDPATERTAMSVIIVQDPRSGLEDADTYDKYKAWVSGQRYFAPELNTTTNSVTRGDRVIQFTSDADATYKAAEYSKLPIVSDYLKYFGNYRLSVRSFRCKEEHTAADSNGNRPPRNGPTAPLANRYQTIPTLQTFPAPATAESRKVDFTNDNWGLNDENEITAYSAGEQQLLPKGVGIQVIVQPITRSELPANVNNPTERYLRTACIMFDPQGRLVMRNFSLSGKSTLGQYLDLETSNSPSVPTDAANLVSGLGVVIYDQQKFKGADPDFSNADWIYQGTQNNNPYAILSTSATLNDFPASPAKETDEELWLDNNTVPLLINRYSGSMTESE